MQGGSAEKNEPDLDLAPWGAAVQFVLKNNDYFAVFGVDGNMNGPIVGTEAELGTAGLFFSDTRYLSRLVLKINGLPLVPLGSSISADNVEFRADLTNRQSPDMDGRMLPANSIHVLRRRVLHGGLWETLTVTNYTGQPFAIDLTIELGADFRDIFEVRGASRADRGRLIPPVIGSTDVVFGYEGLNGKIYRTTIAYSKAPHTIEGRSHFEIRLGPGEREELEFSVLVNDPSARDAGRSYAAARTDTEDHAESRLGNLGGIVSSNAQFNAWIDRSAADLALLITDFPTGPYPYAGIPWFSVPFGRDAIITALQTLWLEPAVAMGVLRYLAGRQADSVSPIQDSAPGKILHESRRGEMSDLGEVPFGAYYGGVDTTPLFIVLAGEYFRRTGDLGTVEELWPSVRAALGWIDEFGDQDGDGFVEYQRGDKRGLRNQGWKDSGDAIFYPDGRLVDGGVALVEVQAYVVAAKAAAADIAAALGDTAMAGDLRRQSRALAKSFDETFWDEKAGTYVIGLDSRKEPLAVLSSNAFHPLFVGAVPGERAALLARQATGDDMFSGWGIRTIGRGEARYNPMAYHNGSVWPHDNAIAASGLGRYGHKAEACRILSALFDVACGVPGYRLPELYCGFDRGSEPQPVAYPGACAPQAWAAAVPYGCLSACLGLEIDATEQTIVLRNPVLPDWLHWVRVKALGLGENSASLVVWRNKEIVEAEMSGLPGGYRFSVDNKALQT